MTLSPCALPVYFTAMIRTLRSFAMLALCLALVAGSVTTAVARGQVTALNRGGVTLVLCSGFGYRTVSLDARGNPLGPLHPCPDCLAGLSAYIAPEPSLLRPQTLVAREVQPVPAPHTRTRIMADAPRARGPPLVV